MKDVSEMNIDERSVYLLNLNDSISGYHEKLSIIRHYEINEKTLNILANLLVSKTSEEIIEYESSELLVELLAYQKFSYESAKKIIEYFKKHKDDLYKFNRSYFFPLAGLKQEQSSELYKESLDLLVENLKYINNRPKISMYMSFFSRMLIWKNFKYDDFVRVLELMKDELFSIAINQPIDPNMSSEYLSLFKSILYNCNGLDKHRDIQERIAEKMYSIDFLLQGREDSHAKIAFLLF